MKGFLSGVAQKINTRHDGDFKDVIILTPNRRAGLFLQRELNALQDKPMWSPRLFTIDDWVGHHSGYAEADRLSCIYRLFEIWRSRVHKNEKFENFYFWGDRLLNDFDLIDKYLVNEDRLFSTITEEKEIDIRFNDWEEELKAYLHEFWSSIRPKSGHREEHPEQIQAFLTLWQQMGPIKKLLESKLLENGIAYSGMMYRSLANDIQQLDKWKDHHIYLTGFNRLNRCEERIIKYCLDKLNATAYWNYDINILNKNYDYNDAARFLKKWNREVKNSQDLASDWQKDEKEINLYGITRQAGQAKFIGEILERSEIAQDETMIVLPDESLLLPLLGALPEDIESVNVSMGVALKETPMYTFVEAFLNVHQHYDEQANSFLRTDVLRLLRHPYVSSKVPEFISVHIDQKELLETDDQLMRYLFHTVEKSQSGQLFENLLGAMKCMHEWHVKQFEKGGGLAEYNAEVIVFAFQRIRRLQGIYEEQDMELDFPALIKLMRHYFKNARIPFKGEPLEGLQILGPLEARNLDFRQVIIPNMNEGVFPGTPTASLIPFHLQKAFGLPTYEDEMAEYAYYFYMSMARTSKAHFLYNVIPDDVGAKEQSRFLQNLEILDFPKWMLNDSKQIQEAGLKPAPPIIIKKDKPILKAIEEHLKNGVSPSAINTYLTCQLKYYFRYIEKLDEKREVREGYKSENIGSVLHRTMEELYAGYEGKKVEEQDIKNLMGNTRAAIEKAIEEELGVAPAYQNEGEALLIVKLMEDYTSLVLKYDLKRVPFRMMQHEYVLNGAFKIDAKVADSIRIKGRIDRIDEKNGITTISDYKTGKVGFSDQSGRIYSISSLLDAEENSRHKEAVQLFLYAMAMKADEKYKNKDIRFGLYTLREMADANTYSSGIFIKPKGSRGNLHIEQIDALTDEHTEEFRSALSALVDQMLDPGVEITQTEDRNVCKYCPYVQICKRR